MYNHTVTHRLVGLHKQMMQLHTAINAVNLLYSKYNIHDIALQLLNRQYAI